MVDTAERLDELLQAWDERLARVDANLVALEADPTYQLLARPGGLKASLEGVTRDRVAPALEAIDELFEGRQRLAQVIDEARECRSRISALTFWDNSEHLRRGFELLEGPSIQRAVVPTPLASRALLGTTARDASVTPDALLAEMVQRFDVARDGVAALSRAWSELDREVESLEREVVGLRADGAVLPSPSVLAGEIAEVERELDHVRRRVSVDPLGSEVYRLHVLRPQVEALRQRVAADRALRHDVELALARAQTTERALVEGHARARDAVARAREHFVQAPQWPQPCDDETLTGLGAWLGTLEKTVGVGHWAPARVGLERWAQAAATCGAVDGAAVRAVEERTRWREELAGRVSARRAQARAMASRAGGGAASAQALRVACTEVEAAADRVAAALAQSPTDVDEAETAARTLEHAIAKLRACALHHPD
jgi:hypothetical protein